MDLPDVPAKSGLFRNGRQLELNRGLPHGSPSLYHAASALLQSLWVDTVTLYLSYDLRHPVKLHYFFNINEEIKEEYRR